MKPIDIPGYLVDEYGTVYTVKVSGGSLRKSAPRPLKPARHYRTQHLRVRLYDGRIKKPVWRYVHLLVAMAFLGPRPDPDAELRHLDGDVDNNHVDNLCWGTQAENNADRARHMESHVPEGTTYTPDPEIGF